MKVVIDEVRSKVGQDAAWAGCEALRRAGYWAEVARHALGDLYVIVGFDRLPSKQELSAAVEVYNDAYRTEQDRLNGE